jgi:hypothetical protein
VREIFREQIKLLDESLKPIPEKNHEKLVKDWPDISIRLNDAINTARSIEHVANEIQGKLIRELEVAAQVGLTAGARSNPSIVPGRGSEAKRRSQRRGRRLRTAARSNQ